MLVISKFTKLLGQYFAVFWFRNSHHNTRAPVKVEYAAVIQGEGYEHVCIANSDNGNVLQFDKNFINAAQARVLVLHRFNINGNMPETRSHLNVSRIGGWTTRRINYSHTNKCINDFL